MHVSGDFLHQTLLLRQQGIGGIVLVYGIDRVTRSRYKVDAKKDSITLAPAGEEEKPQTQEPVKNQ